MGLKEDIKKSPLSDKLVYIGSLAVLIGFFLPLTVGQNAYKAIDLPYGWVLFMIALSVPLVNLFVDWRKRDLIITLSEVLAVASVLGLVIFNRLMPLFGAFGMSIFDIINVGLVFVMVGSIVTFVGTLMSK